MEALQRSIERNKSKKAPAKKSSPTKARKRA
jgi:hypothetical protein